MIKPINHYITVCYNVYSSKERVDKHNLMIFLTCIQFKEKEFTSISYHNTASICGKIAVLIRTL